MRKPDTYGILSAIVATVFIFLILWVITIPSREEVEEEGIVVSFGEYDMGGGELLPPPETTPTQATPPPSTTPTPTPTEKVITQTETQSLVVAEKEKKRKKEEERLKKIAKQKEQDRLREIQRQKALETARQEELARRKQQEREATNRANATIGGAFSNNSGNQSGNSEGDYRQGNPAGRGSSGGHSWSLNGRGLIGGISTPEYLGNQEGKVTVQIRVNNEGIVTAATIGTPTNISDKSIRKAAIKAAKQTRFTQGSSAVRGSITFNFKLK